MNKNQNQRLFLFYIKGYEDGASKKKPRVFHRKGQIYTYYVQDCIWAYNKGYEMGLYHASLKKID